MSQTDTQSTESVPAAEFPVPSDQVTSDDAPDATMAPGAKFAAGPPTPDWARRRGTVGGPDDLPPYGRSLLKIKLPLAVTLASTRRQIGEIVRLRPGSILQFDKSCEEAVELSVGNQLVAEGEAVKVGDKYGIRITSIKLPGERFSTVQLPGGSSQSAGPASTSESGD